ncbi:2Fe-2S iron-sulfur cluster-binding protein [Cohnella algarum]|uniref:2Fe-2S iron-sulfur cluster-binding protein n=1 Tax=Cohnella algarum TaxID=2044859 RepID=UPI0019683C39|nr:2Fe-2S iron-sulfur cluster-binding protein [Cohnella algarum]MBN2984323.1 2Fe-2S iron-sulfur cluster binding domain-containing protein [Cohnella algarum]
MTRREFVNAVFLPDGQSVKVRAGTTVLEAARKARANVRTRCGGVAGCLMCKVSVDEANRSGLSEPTAAELRKLGPLAEQGTRLACQARLLRDAVVQVPEDPLKAAVRKKLAEQAEEDLW